MMPLFEMTFSYSILAGLLERLTLRTRDHEWDVMLCINQRQKAMHEKKKEKKIMSLEIHTNQTAVCVPVIWPINNYNFEIRLDFLCNVKPKHFRECILCPC